MSRSFQKKAVNKKRLDIYLAVMALFVAVSTIYWSLYAVNAYNTFHEYGDFGSFVYPMYYHLHYSNIVWGFQYLVFGNHIAPDMLLVLPIYAIFQSPLTLLFIQVVVLSLTGAVLFFVARDLLKDKGLALLLVAAYFLNPGMHGMLIAEFHAECLIILFYILTFYFYMKKEMKWMVVSLALLLGTMEVAPFLGLMLGVGLVLYEMRYTKDKRARDESVRFAITIALISLAALASYSLIESHLAKAYVSGYAGLPPSMEVLSINIREFKDFIGVINGTKNYANPAYLKLLEYYIVAAFVVVFFGFGIAPVLDPIISVVLTSPWLIEVLLLGNLYFTLTWRQYFGLVLGGVIVAALLTMKRLMEAHNKRALFRAVFVSSIAAFVMLLTVMEPMLVRSPISDSYSQSFLLQVNAPREKNYSNLNYVISIVPTNASLMAPDFVMPHVCARKYFEVIGSDSTFRYERWFTPQYIITDNNTNISLLANDSNSGNLSFSSEIKTGEYVLYAKNGTAMLYKLNPNWNGSS